jgi:hypothetical protein
MNACTTPTFCRLPLDRGADPASQIQVETRGEGVNAGSGHAAAQLPEVCE